MKTRDKERLKVLRKMRRAVPKIPGLSAETFSDIPKLARNPANIRMAIKWHKYHIFILEVPSRKVAWIYPGFKIKDQELPIGRNTTMIGNIPRKIVDLKPSPQAAMRTICTKVLLQFLDRHTIDTAEEFTEEMKLIQNTTESIKQHEKRNARAFLGMKAKDPPKKPRAKMPATHKMRKLSPKQQQKKIKGWWRHKEAEEK